MTENRYQAMGKMFRSGEYTSIKTNDKKSYRRIVNRCMANGWWFASWQQEGSYYIGFSQSVDLEKNLRAKLPTIIFELD